MKHSAFGVFAILLLIVAVVVFAITSKSVWQAPKVEVHTQTSPPPK